MASIVKDRNRSTGEYNGCHSIQFVASDGRRKTIRLGKSSRKAAEAIKTKVEAILADSLAQISWSRETADWVGNLEPALYGKLAAVGILPKREQVDAATLGPFLEAFIAGQNVKLSTTQVYGHTQRCLVEYFGAGKPLEDISPGDTDEWRIWLGKPIDKKNPSESGQGLSPNTVRRRCGIARQFFTVAKRKRLIIDNPFADMREGVTVRANRERDYFVTREEADKVLAACPDNEWRLIFALSRFGGLRCPSEHLALTWDDVNWEQQRIIVRSPKTAHHEGKEFRVMPLFPELRELLEDAFHNAPEGSKYVISRYRDAAANLRTQLMRIVRRAGLSPWPKLFQNLRASRATELVKDHPAHVAASWLGHSEVIAQKHYWQTTDADYESALQKATQTSAARGSLEPSSKSGNHYDPREKHATRVFPVGGTRLELVTSTV